MDDGTQLRRHQESGDLGRKSRPKDQRVGSGMVVSAVAGLLGDHRCDESGTYFEQRRWSELGSYGGRIRRSERHFKGRQPGFSVKHFASCMSLSQQPRTLWMPSTTAFLLMMQLAASPTPIVAGWLISNMAS